MRRYVLPLLSIILVKCSRIRRIIQLRTRAETIRTCFSTSHSTLQIHDRRRISSAMASSFVPDRFDSGDFDHWFRQFD